MSLHDKKEKGHQCERTVRLPNKFTMKENKAPKKGSKSLTLFEDNVEKCAVNECLSYTAVVVHVHVVQPAEVLVGLQEAGQLLVLSGRLRQQLPSLPFLHVPAEQEVSKVLKVKSAAADFEQVCKIFSYEMLSDSTTTSCLHLVSKLGHVVLQAALVVRLLAHLHQDVKVAVLLSQRRHPLVLTELHCNKSRVPDLSRIRGREKAVTHFSGSH